MELPEIAGHSAAGDTTDQAMALYRVDIADIANRAVVDSAADPKPAVVVHCTARIALDLLVSLVLAPTVDCTPQILAVHPTADSFALVGLVEDTAEALAVFEVEPMAALAAIVEGSFVDKLDLVVVPEEVTSVQEIDLYTASKVVLVESVPLAAAFAEEVAVGENVEVLDPFVKPVKEFECQALISPALPLDLDFQDKLEVVVPSLEEGSVA